MPKADDRLQLLRQALSAHEVDDYIIPSSDEHLNEYLPRWRCRREFLSGFSGSAGDLLVGRSDAWLYADGRYHLQADSELAGSSISVMKVGAKGSKSLLTHLEDRVRDHPGHVIGFDAFVLPASFVETMTEKLRPLGAVLKAVPGNLVDPIWEGCPERADSRLIQLPDVWTGASPAEKLIQVRKDLHLAGAAAHVVVKLDQIAWLTNLRSKDDVPYNPVFESFLIIEREAVHLFLRHPKRRLPENFEAQILELKIHDYDAFAAHLNKLSGTILIDPAGITAGVVSSLEKAGCRLIRALSPLEARKAIKNPAEREAQKRANLRASVAKTQAILWLRRERLAKRRVTENGFRIALEGFYRKQPDYFDLSFNTIAATGAHGAIVHYGQCDETELKDGDLFIIDSGAHIGGGTTDDTRTLAVGAMSAEARRLYTLVLKGHIRAARQRIPDGTPGTALDALARAPLWEAGLTYEHGTGHGVGTFLNVHEGPFSIAERERRSPGGQPLREGIVSSIEPGYYRAGFGGIRLENLYLFVKDDVPDQSRSWLKLESITWVPFEKDLIDRSLLDAQDLAWLDAYHAGCEERLAPLLSASDRNELAQLLR